MTASIRVLTFNTHAGIGVDGHLDLGRIVDIVGSQRAQMVGLQEVDRHFGPRSDHADQPAELSFALGMSAIYHATVARNRGHQGQPAREYGHAVLTRCEVVEHDFVPLPGQLDHEPRGLTRVRLDVAGVPLLFWNVHLANEDDGARVEQARAIRRLLAEVTEPLVLVGDLNAEPSDEPLRILTAELVDAWSAVHGAVGGATFVSERPTARIDYILTTPDIGITEVAVLDVAGASDHRAVVAALELPD